MEELADILDKDTGVKTGKILPIDEAHRIGLWHGSAHILIVNNNHTKTLLQKRCNEKNFFPNIWDVAVGGHISAGEDDLTTAKRELTEELGLDDSKYDFVKLARITEKLTNNGIISNEYVSVFLIVADIDIDDIKLQVEEVSDARWFTKEEFNELLKNGKIVPHIREFEILNKLLK